MITVKPFRESHLDIFNIDPSHKAECRATSKVWDALGKLDQAASHIIDDRIIFIAGYHWIMPGVIEVWMHPSVYLPRYKFSVVKHLRWWFCFIKEATDARRIQTWGAHNEASDRWLISLGFEREGVLESYLPDGSSVSMWRLGARCKPSQQL